MRSFFHFPQAHEIISMMDGIIGPVYKDQVSYTLMKAGQSISTIASMNNDKLLGLAKANFQYHDFDFKLDASTTPSLYFMMHKKLLANQLDTVTTVATRSHKDSEMCAPHIKNCTASFSTNYKADEYTIHGFFGFKNDNSISTLCAISDPRASVALRGFVTDKTNILEATILSTAFGPFAAIRGDVSSFVLQKVKIGTLKKFQFRHSSFASLFAYTEIMRRSFGVGLAAKLPDNVSVAIKGGYSSSKRKPKFDAGFDVVRTGRFVGKINIDGEIEMKTTFTPMDMVTVTLRSKTSVKEKFDRINFGWSLDFYQKC
ncbi:hypothetical protein TRFO_16408 [Tritrichomonas foetus]|uniref:Uncharacterized protein n=1 Tax=Tritrichomonas foetus TaxID=1144522 RepID=A0A1J4KQ43_9EUKA|nr:hypothetical protein TRFO_16408 [Tritrichomonas foetus]|eukprot:OHT13425.1 hypothetical protein TRFO_16408 [Tritrichomonas foetus]